MKRGPVAKAVMQTINGGLPDDAVWRLRLPRRRGRARMSQLDAHFGNDDRAISNNEYYAMQRNERRRAQGSKPADRAEVDIVVLALRRLS